MEENPGTRPDLALHLGVTPYEEATNHRASEELLYASSDTNDRGEPVVSIWRTKRDESVRVTYEDGTQFWFDQKLENIWATWPEHSPLENTACYLLGPVLGLLLRWRGVTCLHASAVAVDDRAVAFVGPPGAGKSTTAAACAKVGHAVVSDDILAIEERDGVFHVLPAHPQVRLWPESVELLYGGPESLVRLHSEWDKRHLGLGDYGTRFEGRALPLAAIYLLGERLSEDRSLVETLWPREALISLVRETYASKTLDRQMRAREFEVLGRLVLAVPVRRLRAPANHLDDLCRVVSGDLRGSDFGAAAPPLRTS